MKSAPIKYTLVILALLAVLVFLNSKEWLNAPKDIFFNIISVPAKILIKTGENTSSFFYRLIYFNEIKKESEALFIENRGLLSQLSRFREIKRENEIFRKALGIAQEEGFDLVPAQIIGLNFLNFDHTILIDKGRNDGLKENLPVISEDKILIGKIVETYPTNSKVITLSNSIINVAVTTQESRARGILKGMGNQNEFLADSVAKEARIEIGEFVTTSGFDNIFPEGILIGKVKRIENRDIELFQQAYIEPLISFKNLETIFVVTKY